MTQAASAQGTTILQYAQTSDGQQILVPSNQVVVQGVQGIFLRNPNVSILIQACFAPNCHFGYNLKKEGYLVVVIK